MGRISAAAAQQREATAEESVRAEAAVYLLLRVRSPLQRSNIEKLTTATVYSSTQIQDDISAVRSSVGIKATSSL